MARSKTTTSKPKKGKSKILRLIGESPSETATETTPQPSTTTYIVPDSIDSCADELDIGVAEIGTAVDEASYQREEKLLAGVKVDHNLSEILQNSNTYNLAPKDKHTLWKASRLLGVSHWTEVRVPQHPDTVILVPMIHKLEVNNSDRFQKTAAKRRGRPTKSGGGDQVKQPTSNVGSETKSTSTTTNIGPIPHGILDRLLDMLILCGNKNIGGLFAAAFMAHATLWCEEDSFDVRYWVLEVTTNSNPVINNDPNKTASTAANNTSMPSLLAKPFEGRIPSTRKQLVEMLSNSNFVDGGSRPNEQQQTWWTALEDAEMKSKFIWEIETVCLGRSERSCLSLWIRDMVNVVIKKESIERGTGMSFLFGMESDEDEDEDEDEADGFNDAF